MEEIKKVTSKTIQIQRDGVNFSVSFIIGPDVLRHIDTYKGIIADANGMLDKLKEEIMTENPLKFVAPMPTDEKGPVGN